MVAAGITSFLRAIIPLKKYIIPGDVLDRQLHGWGIGFMHKERSMRLENTDMLPSFKYLVSIVAKVNVALAKLCGFPFCRLHYDQTSRFSSSHLTILLAK